MGILLLLVVPLIALAIMSPAMRAFSILVFLGSLAYAAWVKFGQSIAGPSTEQVGMLFTLYGLNIGLFVLGTVLGLIRSACQTEADYLWRRNRLFRFLLIWGLPFLVIKQALSIYIDYDTGEEGSGAFLMGFVGSYLFFAYVILAIFARLAYGKLTGR